MPHDVIVPKWQGVEATAHAGRLPFLAAAAHEPFAQLLRHRLPGSKDRQCGPRRRTSEERPGDDPA